jgi:ribosomal protein S18 acetylase RimI-like enzyme
MAAHGGPSVAIVQALPDPRDIWAVSAFMHAGFIRIADLAYRPHPGAPLGTNVGDPVWPKGVTVRTVHGCAPGDPDRELLIESLERTYEDTLDCPGLCGLRSTSDVLDSHRASGRWDGRHWRLVFQDERPHGCLLLSQCPESHVIELVYLGLSPALRGRGLGRKLLQLGLSRVRGLDADHVTCAVDTRNAPALRLYEAFSFTISARRVALVQAIQP